MKRRKRMSAKQRKYFAPKTHRVKRRKVSMARRSYRGVARKGFGGMKSMIAPIVGGVADSYLDPMLPIDGIGATAVGMFMHNETLKNLGLYKVGFSIGNIIPLPGRGGTNAGGFY